MIPGRKNTMSGKGKDHKNSCGPSGLRSEIFARKIAIGNESKFAKPRNDKNRFHSTW